MQLLGVEFTDYACFTERLVPLRPGVQILVGRNNAGKTAILRGLGAMSGLPITGSAKLDRGLEGYTRNGGPTPYFGLNVWFAIGAEDWPLFAFNPSEPPFYDTHTSTLVFQLRVFSQQTIVGLTSCVIRAGSREVEAIHRDPSGSYAQGRIDGAGIIRHTEPLAVLAGRSNVGDLGAFPVLKPAPLLQNLLPLTNVQWVEARRFARTNLQAKEEKFLPANAESLAPYLLTLQGSKKKTFNRIQDFITRIFPEFEPRAQGELRRFDANFRWFRYKSAVGVLWLRRGAITGSDYISPDDSIRNHHLAR